jgi:glycosyl transferase family 25
MRAFPSYFGCTYVINLPERTDRLDRVRKELTAIASTICDGDGGVEVFPAYKYPDRAGFPSAGVRGCFLSHLKCLKLAHDAGRPSALILEDDVAFSSALLRLTPALAAQLDSQHWDIVFFGHFGTGDIPDARPTISQNEISFIPWAGEIQGMHFYAVNGRIFPQLIADLDRHIHGIEGDQEYGPMPIDGAFNIFRRNNPAIRTLIAQPKLGWQASSRSDITPRLIDRIPFLQPVLRPVRKLKAAVARWSA